MADEEQGVFPGMPEGIRVRTVGGFSPQLTEALQNARESGKRFLVAVAIGHENGNLDLHVSHGDNWLTDWTLRAHAEIFALSARSSFEQAARAAAEHGGKGAVSGNGNGKAVGDDAGGSHDSAG